MIKWHGGKHYLASRLAYMFPPHTRYLEAFAGSLALLTRVPQGGRAEWANDLNGDLINWWRVLRDTAQFEAFLRCVEATPFSEVVFKEAQEQSTDDPVKRAWAFFILNRQSRQALGSSYATPTRRIRRGMNENVSAWLTAVEGLPGLHARLRTVEIWQRPAAEAIKKLDGDDFFTYCDPPYVHETRITTGEYGEHEMSLEQHKKLLGTLARMRGLFMLSGYRNELYDEMADCAGWFRYDFDVPNHASGRQSKERKVESVWTNYQVQEYAQKTLT